MVNHRKPLSRAEFHVSFDRLGGGPVALLPSFGSRLNMGMRLSFELTDRDLRFFRDALRKSRDVVQDAEDAEIVDAVRGVIADIRKSEPLPDFVATRLPELEAMIQMLNDDDWRLPERDRERILAAFVYFGDPEDILPDDIPVIGYLDDVIILELVARDLQHVREAYVDFCRFRDEFDMGPKAGTDAAVRRDRLDRRRQQLHQRMRRRTSRFRKTKLW
jgi:uncharacterized membrane protein YkvA (DUF1232 family)